MLFLLTVAALTCQSSSHSTIYHSTSEATTNTQTQKTLSSKSHPRKGTLMCRLLNECPVRVRITRCRPMHGTTSTAQRRSISRRFMRLPLHWDLRWRLPSSPCPPRRHLPLLARRVCRVRCYIYTYMRAHICSASSKLSMHAAEILANSTRIKISV